MKQFVKLCITVFHCVKTCFSGGWSHYSKFSCFGRFKKAKKFGTDQFTMNQIKGALRARSFSAASWQIPGTSSIFFHGRESQLTFGAFGFRWNA